MFSSEQADQNLECQDNPYQHNYVPLMDVTTKEGFGHSVPKPLLYGYPGTGVSGAQEGNLGGTPTAVIFCKDLLEPLEIVFQSFRSLSKRSRRLGLIPGGHSPRYLSVHTVYSVLPEVGSEGYVAAPYPKQTPFSGDTAPSHSEVPQSSDVPCRTAGSQTDSIISSRLTPRQTDLVFSLLGSQTDELVKAFASAERHRLSQRSVGECT